MKLFELILQHSAGRTCTGAWERLMKDWVKIRIELDASCDAPEVIIRTPQKTEFAEKLASAVERYAKSDMPRIAVTDGSATVLLEQTDILRVYTELRKLMVHTVRGTFEAR